MNKERVGGVVLGVVTAIIGGCAPKWLEGLSAETGFVTWTVIALAGVLSVYIYCRAGGQSPPSEPGVSIVSNNQSGGITAHTVNQPADVKKGKHDL